MKKTIITAICLLFVATAFAEKVKVIPIVITTKKIIQQTATHSVVLPPPPPPPPPVEEAATPSWLIATPTASLTIDIGGNQQ